jgi:putative ATPase
MSPKHEADLFDSWRQQPLEHSRPLAVRMRPRSLEEFVGQQHFLGPGKLLRRMLEADRLSSLIFYGPPGCGKTALAQLIAEHTRSHFCSLNAVAAGVKEVRQLLTAARQRLENGNGRTILFIDEIHRFSRSQQDVLLPEVEEGVVILIGATTQNPLFALTAPLLSRSTLFVFEPLTDEQIVTLLERALRDPQRGLGRHPVHADTAALQWLAQQCEGDARRALNALEIGVQSVLAAQQRGEVPAGPIRFDITLAQQSIQRKVLPFDPTGDSHYDLASAFIKSLRGSDPDAALYWLARLLESGEDPRFIARRLVIFASEDIGNADPFALVLAQAVWEAVERIGLPECRLNLSQGVCYLATAPKSNACTVAIGEAVRDVHQGRTLAVPSHLRDAHYRGAQEVLGHGVGYVYPHDQPGGFVVQEYLPIAAEYYRPTDRGHEAQIRARLEQWRRARAQALEGTQPPAERSDPTDKTAS